MCERERERARASERERARARERETEREVRTTRVHLTPFLAFFGGGGVQHEAVATGLQDGCQKLK